MRRYFLLVAVVLIVSCWTQPARAQYGFNFGQTADPIAEIEAARNKVKQDRTKYAKPGGGRGPPAVLPSAADSPTRTAGWTSRAMPSRATRRCVATSATPESREAGPTARRGVPHAAVRGADRPGQVAHSVCMKRDGRGRPVPRCCPRRCAHAPAVWGVAAANVKSLPFQPISTASPGLDPLLEQRGRQRVGQPLLDHPLERPGAVGRVEALPRPAAASPSSLIRSVKLGLGELPLRAAGAGCRRSASAPPCPAGGR